MAEASKARRARGELESQVLATLWAANEPMTAGDVQQELGGDLAQTTVLTILTRLCAKGALQRARRGRWFYYEPVADRAGLTARRMHELLDAEAQRGSVLTQFVSELGGEDEQLLRQLLRDADENGRPGQVR